MHAGGAHTSEHSAQRANRTPEVLPGDLVARIGGEEFIVVIDGAGREDAVRVADEVRGLLSERSVRAENGTPLQVTVSAGCAELDPDDPTRESLLRIADVALFMAKRAGRDRVVAA